jgi:hypothetical protein
MVHCQGLCRCLILPPNGGFFFLSLTLDILMLVPNHQHNSGKPAKRRLKPAALKARKAALAALKRKLTAR